jgi:hypothetical protein
MVNYSKIVVHIYLLGAMQRSGHHTGKCNVHCTVGFGPA